MSVIIGISGKKRAGKNLVTEIFKEVLGEANKSYLHLAFGDSVKKACSVALGFEEDYFFNECVKDEVFEFVDGVKMSGRKIMQVLGTEAARDNFNDSIWLTSVSNKIKRSSVEIILISDLRFKNEFEFIKSNNGFCIRVEREGLISEDNHISEIDLDDAKFDFHIYNPKIQEFKDSIREQVKCILTQIN